MEKFNYHFLHLHTLPEQDMKIWLMFVDACKLLCNHLISKSNAKKAADLLLKFNKCVEDLYGIEACTMNMHLHCHLYKCLLDIGPIYRFWCFPFERLNCILGSVATNNHDVTTQLMKKFILRQVLNSSDTKDNFPDSLYPYIEEITTFTQKNPFQFCNRISCSNTH